MDFFYSEYIDNQIIRLTAEESYHCIKVMRYRKGDTIAVTDGNGNLYKCIIEIADTRESELSIIEKLESKHSTEYSLRLFVAPTKNHDRIEWLVEKATEIGLKEFTPIITQHSERDQVNLSRLKKVAIAAIKQSQKTILPKINQVVEFNKAISEIEKNGFIAHCYETNENHLKRESFFSICPIGEQINCFIGPEGDFTKNEIELAIEKGLKGITLGPARLRTETAALMTCQIAYVKNHLMD